jgi:hypothetical protein
MVEFLILQVTIASELMFYKVLWIQDFKIKDC